MSARFAGRRFEATLGGEDPIEACELGPRVTLWMDFENGAVGRLLLAEGKLQYCNPRPACMGDLDLDLTTESRRP
jgi:hypothetical protein